jgi:hypothetical protein
MGGLGVLLPRSMAFSCDEQQGESADQRRRARTRQAIWWGSSRIVARSRVMGGDAGALRCLNQGRKQSDPGKEQFQRQVSDRGYRQFRLSERQAQGGNRRALGYRDLIDAAAW